MKSDVAEVIDRDVLVIGGGAAGVVAAIEAAKYGVTVGLLDKGRVGFSGSTPTSGAGTCGVFLPEDSTEAFLQETLEGGESVNDPELARILVQEGRRAIELLGIYGVPFLREKEGSLRLQTQVGQKRPRTPSVEGSGAAFMLALRKEALHRGVLFFEETMATELLLSGREVCGCLATGTRHAGTRIFRAKAVILAAGSATELYPYATASFKTTGDGYWLGWQAGLEFINMEFVEFSVMPAPRGIPIPSGGYRPLTRMGARFYNALGERFMERYAPKEMERVARGTMLACIYREVAAGRGPVTMDATAISEEDFRILEVVEGRRILVKLKEVGIDYRRERFEMVSPVVHGFLGGLRTDGNGQTSVAGLYALGETAGAVHGAERVGSFISGCAVFGLRAGRHAAKTALKRGTPAIPKAQAAQGARALAEGAAVRAGLPPERLLEKVQALAGKRLAGIRTAASLQEAMAQLDAIVREELPALRIAAHRDFIRSLELRNLCLTAELVAAAALQRTETRGQHRRDDFSTRDDAWLRHILLCRDGDRIVMTTRPVGAPPLSDPSIR